jgi:hypothetical protein
VSGVFPSYIVLASGRLDLLIFLKKNNNNLAPNVCYLLANINEYLK